jgi:hypothetical protein
MQTTKRAHIGPLGNPPLPQIPPIRYERCSARSVLGEHLMPAHYGARLRVRVVKIDPA